MDDKTLEALKQSIAKWETNVNVAELDDAVLGASYCPLCSLFISDRCASCPVSKKTGQLFCDDTPYDDAELAWITNDLPAFKRAAQQEVDFLKSLLPVERSENYTGLGY